MYLFDTRAGQVLAGQLPLPRVPQTLKPGAALVPEKPKQPKQHRQDEYQQGQESHPDV